MAVVEPNMTIPCHVVMVMDVGIAGDVGSTRGRQSRSNLPSLDRSGLGMGVGVHLYQRTLRTRDGRVGTLRSILS